MSSMSGQVEFPEFGTTFQGTGTRDGIEYLSFRHDVGFYDLPSIPNRSENLEFHDVYIWDNVPNSRFYGQEDSGFGMYVLNKYYFGVEEVDGYNVRIGDGTQDDSVVFNAPTFKEVVDWILANS